NSPVNGGRVVGVRLAPPTRAVAHAGGCTVATTSWACRSSVIPTPRSGIDLRPDPRIGPFPSTPQLTFTGCLFSAADSWSCRRRWNGTALVLNVGLHRAHHGRGVAGSKRSR